VRTAPATSDVLREVGRRIQQARLAAGLTQEQAAARAGIDYKRWQRIEQGGVNPTIRTLVSVASALDTTVWTLLGPPEPEPARAPARRSK